MNKWKILEDWTTASGLRAIAIVGIYGSINGYVEVTKESRFYNMEYSKWDMSIDTLEDWTKDKIEAQKHLNDIEVHGGMTYSSMGDKLHMPSTNWWFGFDTAHAWDQPDYDLAIKHFPDQTKEIDIYFEIMRPFAPNTCIRDINYVHSECERLATQLKD